MKYSRACQGTCIHEYIWLSIRDMGEDLVDKLGMQSVNVSPGATDYKLIFAPIWFRGEASNNSSGRLSLSKDLQHVAVLCSQLYRAFQENKICIFSLWISFSNICLISIILWYSQETYYIQVNKFDSLIRKLIILEGYSLAYFTSWIFIWYIHYLVYSNFSM